MYIFHKGIISEVLCGYDVQMNMLIFDFDQKSTFNAINIIKDTNHETELVHYHHNDQTLTHNY